MMTRCGRPAAGIAAVVTVAVLPPLAFAGPANAAGVVGGDSAAVSTSGASARIDCARSRTVYFPRGCWRAAGGKRYRGPAAVEVAAPLGELPWFTRCASQPLG